MLQNGKYQMRKTIIMFLLGIVVGNGSVFAQTLQIVTDNGNTTSNGITLGSGYTNSKLNVNAIGVDTNNSTDVTMIVANQKYNSTHQSGENRIVFAWGNHWAAAIAAYKETINTTGFKFFTEHGFNVPIERMRITSLGNVGIGTASPSEKLSVNGKIRAHEIKVETANWPDYVFAKNYKLPSLQETEQHIKDKGHLLGIPSAEEVKTNGVDLGEMNSKLLKKIEELTLYLIDQNKLIQTQQKLLEQQQKSIETIHLKLK
ncbi:hypothetical protein [Pedobacter sp. B4-66]|uniref:hypothetical protein n=1 Tax=Pedobacter sp. B4-66 TaxID=2817280 RepID=UPI001BD97FDD|nr:hypothetical protein [Pedobacter sp. B4-66]